MDEALYFVLAMGLLPDTENYGLRMRRECRVAAQNTPPPPSLPSPLPLILTPG